MYRPIRRCFSIFAGQRSCGVKKFRQILPGSKFQIAVGPPVEPSIARTWPADILTIDGQIQKTFHILIPSKMAPDSQFVRALLKAIEETGKTNLAALGDLEALFETARREGEADRRRIERMVEAGVNALAMAHQATERAGLASVRAEGAIDDAIARIAAKMSGGPLSESQKWLVSKQRERNRREPSRLAAWVGAAALAGFIGGYGIMRWWSATESAAGQAVLEAVDRCRVEPRNVRTADGKTVEMCRLADLTTNRPN